MLANRPSLPISFVRDFGRLRSTKNVGLLGSSPRPEGRQRSKSHRPHPRPAIHGFRAPPRLAPPLQSNWAHGRARQKSDERTKKALFFFCPKPRVLCSSLRNAQPPKRRARLAEPTNRSMNPCACACPRLIYTEVRGTLPFWGLSNSKVRIGRKEKMRERRGPRSRPMPRGGPCGASMAKWEGMGRRTARAWIRGKASRMAME